MPASPVLEKYKRRDSKAEINSIRRNLWLSENENKKKQSRRGKSVCSRQFVPWASMVALVVTWSGLFLFCWKMYFGFVDMENLTGGLFKEAAHYLRIGREVILLLGIAMAAFTGTNLVIGFCATLNCELSYRGRMCGCFCNFLGNRPLCGFFWFIGYLFNICWLAILSVLVLLTSAYFCFLPICLPQAGTVDQLCFNFTMIASAISGGSMGPHAVSLILCGGPIDKFCKLTKAITPWYWGAYAGCVMILIGLSHFNACLAANFAHVKHAARYRRIRRRTKGKIKWSSDWRIKSVLVTCPAESTRLSTISGSRSGKGMCGVADGYTASLSESESDSSGSDPSTIEFEAESCSDIAERQRPVRNIPMSRPRTTSTGSIVLQKRPTPPNHLGYNLADTLLYHSAPIHGQIFP